MANKVFKTIDIIYYISKFLPNKDKFTLTILNKSINSMKPLNNILKNLKKKRHIIMSFFIKSKHIFNKISIIYEKEKTMGYHDIHPINTSKMMALYFFKYYEKKYVKSWYNGISSNKFILIRDIIDNTIENPNKYDLYRLQVQMPLENILILGW